MDGIEEWFQNWLDEKVDEVRFQLENCFNWIELSTGAENRFQVKPISTEDVFQVKYDSSGNRS